MNVFEMVAFIVFIGAIASIVKAIVRSRKPDPLAPVQEARLVKLEERVKALEAVVGDSTYELKQKLRELEN